MIPKFIFHGACIFLELTTWNLQKATTAIFLLCAVLVTSLVVIAYLIYTIKKKTCNCCKGNTTFPFRQSDLKVFSKS